MLSRERVYDARGERTKLDAALVSLRRGGWKHRYTNDSELTVCLARGADALAGLPPS